MAEGDNPPAKKRKPGLVSPGFSGCAGRGWSRSRPVSEAQFEEDLSLSWRIALTHIASATCGRVSIAVSADIAKGARAIVHIRVWSADLHAVEKVLEFHSNFHGCFLTKIEMFGEREVLVGCSWVPQVTQGTRLVAHCESRIGERTLVKDGQTLVIVIVIDVQGHTRVIVGAVKSIQEDVVVIGIDGYWSAGGISDYRT